MPRAEIAGGARDAPRQVEVEQEILAEALAAARPWRAITSRSGGSVVERGRSCRRLALRRPAPPAEPRSAAIRLVGSALPLPAMSKRRAMVGRGADEGQAQRDVDAVVEGERLDRDQRLVVIHADAPRRSRRARVGVEHGVGAAAGRVASMPLAQRRDGRCR